MTCYNRYGSLAGLTLVVLAIFSHARADGPLEEHAARLIDEALTASRSAADLAAWHAGGKTPHDVVDAVAGDPSLETAFCRALDSRPPADIAFFETALRLGGDAFATPCRAALLARLSAAAPVPEPEKRPKRDCQNDEDVLGMSRTLEVETKGGPAYGRIKDHKPLGLADKEIVLTFDDGPHPTRTRQVLDILDDHCVKATFFMVGRAAKRRPDIVRDAYKRGHTIANHTFSHKYLRRFPAKEGKAQIDEGEEALRDVLAVLPNRNRPGAAAEPAPFFRFPGLQETKETRAYLSETDRASFSFDICTEDWRRITADEIYEATMKCAKRYGKGILVFHDTREETIKVLPRILTAFRTRGYRVVHMIPREERPGRLSVRTESPAVTDLPE